jgi:hypothetical protein
MDEPLIRKVVLHDLFGHARLQGALHSVSEQVVRTGMAAGVEEPFSVDDPKVG